MAKRAFVEIDDDPMVSSILLDLTGHGSIPVGTVTRGRKLYPTGRGRMIDPKNWIHLKITERLPKAMGNAPVYRAVRI